MNLADVLAGAAVAAAWLCLILSLLGLFAVAVRIAMLSMEAPR